jgi:four helix bundle protein
LEISLGESFELETQLIIAFRTGILPEVKFSLLSQEITELQKMIIGFKNTVEANPY